MSALFPGHAQLTDGIFMYLCSGEMRPFPTATHVDLTHGVFEVRDRNLLLASINQETVWCCSVSETSPSLG